MTPPGGSESEELERARVTLLDEHSQPVTDQPVDLGTEAGLLPSRQGGHGSRELRGQIRPQALGDAAGPIPEAQCEKPSHDLGDEPVPVELRVNSLKDNVGLHVSRDANESALAVC